MINDQKKIKFKKLSVAYVFSKGNQVYIKNNTYEEEEEWFPVNFQWKTN